MSKLGDFAIGMFGPKIIISTLKKQNPEELGKDAGDTLDKILDDEFGNAKSEQVQDFLAPWLNRFAKALTKRLMEKSKEISIPVKREEG